MSSVEMVRLIEAVGADLASCTDSELVEALAATEKVRSAMAAHAAALTAACDHRQVPATDGAASAGVWAARLCDLPTSDARRMVRQARRLETMSVTAGAFAAGRIGEAKVALLVAARTDRLADEFVRCEATLVDAATSLSCDDLAQVLERWRLAARDAVTADPADVEAEDDPQSRPTEIFLSPTMDGRFALSGTLTFEDGSILTHGIEAAMRRLFHRGARLSDGARFEPAQRRGAALVETFKRGVTADPDQAGAQPLLIGVVDLELLARRAERDRLRLQGDSGDGRCGRPPLDSGPSEEERALTLARAGPLVAERCRLRGKPPPARWRPLEAPPPSRSDDSPPGVASGEECQRVSAGDPTATMDDDRAGGALSVPVVSAARQVPAAVMVPDRFDLAGLALVPAPDPADPFDLGRCEIPGVGPIPVDMARRLACNGRMARLVLGADSVPLDYGRDVRLATPEQRHALIVRDRGCAFPGCDRPPPWCEAHHIDFFVDHEGLTDLANLALLCSHHHHLVHEGHWIFARADTGWVAQSPAGKRLHRAVPT